VFAAEYFPRIIAGALITALHALGLYAAAVNMAASRSPASMLPVAVRFIQEAPSQPSPPRPLHVAIQPVHEISTVPPDLHFAVELPVPSARAITLPQRDAVAGSPLAEPAGPTLVSFVEYVHQPAPKYPPQSRRLKEEGVVVLRVLIDERGRACEIVVESSSGYARLDHAAREAVESAVFRPYIEDGAPRRALVLIPIEFFLSRAAA
jgi:periplasmic protein TonB